MGSKDVILELLKKNVGQLVSNDEITKTTGIRSWARQLRFLRQEGYNIEYIHKTKGYILHSIIKKEGKKRYPISNKQKYRILKRNGFVCRACGRGAADGVKLSPDHKIPVDQESKKEYPDKELQTLCVSCNEGKKHWYSDFDREEIDNILSLKSGSARIEQIFRYRKGKPVKCEILEALSGIREWTRIIRSLREKKNMDITWDSKSKTYTYTAS